jgi:hypothetical protein
MLPTIRSFSEYHTDDETTLIECVFEEYKDTVSAEQASFIWSEAYDRRHSGGLEEVYYEFVWLVRFFDKVQKT